MGHRSNGQGKWAEEDEGWWDEQVIWLSEIMMHHTIVRSNNVIDGQLWSIMTGPRLVQRQSKVKRFKILASISNNLIFLKKV